MNSSPLSPSNAGVSRRVTVESREVNTGVGVCGGGTIKRLAGRRDRNWEGFMKLCLLACASLCAAQSITIKTGTLIDGRGGVLRNVVVSVEGSKITRIEPAGVAKSTYDLSALTLMPGWIDTHSHPNTHFDKNNGCVADRPEVVW